MLALQKILHPTDFSKSASAAFERALYLARKYESELHLMHVARPFGRDLLRGVYERNVDEDAFQRRVRDEAEEQMQALIARHAGEDVPCKRLCALGAVPAEVIADHAEAAGVDLIVLGTHGRRGVRRFMLGSVAEEVVRRASCDVLTVRGDRPPAVQRLLVPVDLSPHTRPLLEHALDLSTVCGAELDVLHVIEPVPPSLAAMEEVVLPDLEPRVRASIRKRLEELLEELVRPGMQSEVHLRTGRPASAIAHFAEERASDLIMVAARGYTALEHVLIGSVTEHVMRAAPCPVWTMRAASADRPGSPAGRAMGA